MKLVLGIRVDRLAVKIIELRNELLALRLRGRRREGFGEGLELLALGGDDELFRGVHEVRGRLRLSSFGNRVDEDELGVQPARELFAVAVERRREAGGRFELLER